MTLTARPAEITIRGVVININEECWTCQESGEEFTDEAMTDHNLDQAWAAYWRTLPLTDLITMRETAVRDIAGIDRAMLGARFDEEMAAVGFKIDREVLARFERGQCLTCEPQREWFWYADGNVVGMLSGDEFESIRRLTDKGLLKNETR